MKKIIYTIFALGLGASQLEAQSLSCYDDVGSGCPELMVNLYAALTEYTTQNCPLICNATSPCTSTCSTIFNYMEEISSGNFKNISYSALEVILNNVCTTYGTGTNAWPGWSFVCPTSPIAGKTTPKQQAAPSTTGQKPPAKRR